jgi:hypothetical protein
MRLSISGVLMLLYVDIKFREVNNPLLKDGKNLTAALMYSLV